MSSGLVHVVDASSGHTIAVMSREAFDEAVAVAAPLRHALLAMLADNLAAAQPNLDALYPRGEQP